MTTPADRDAVIRIDELVTRVGGLVLHDHIDLEVLRGEVMGVVGSSGSGKSVLLRSIIGLQHPAGGRIEVLGRNIAELDGDDLVRMQVRWGVLFQDGALFSDQTVAQNVQIPLREHTDLPQQLMNEIASVRLSMVGLPADAAKKYPAELSGGMRKRAGLARALALDPEILFLDEPTAGLDPISAAEFDVLVRELQKSLRLSVFMVTHDIDTLRATTDRIAVLVDRRIRVGTMASLSHDPHPSIHRYLHRGPRADERGQLAGVAGMDSQANYVATGAFVLLMLAGMVVAAVWLAGPQFRAQYALYEVHVSGSVSGLDPGAPVRLNGIDVGRVASIEQDPEDPEKVILLLQLREGVIVHSDAVASLDMQGLTGGRYMEISGGTIGSPKASAAPGRRYPTIAWRPSSVDVVFNSAPALLQRLADATDKLRALLDDRNRRAISGMLANTNDLTAVLDRHSEDVDHLLADSAATMHNLREASATLGNVLEHVDGTSDNADRLVTSANLMIERTTKLADDLDGVVLANRAGVRELTTTVPEHLDALIARVNRLTESLDRV